MIELSKVIELPDTIEVNGNSISINTDFNFLILFCSMVHEKHLLSEYDFMYPGEKPIDRQAGFNELIKFAFPPQELPRDLEESSTSKIILDYIKDEDLIYSAFWQQYKIDLKAPKLHLHWYKFRSLINGLTDTLLNKVMEWRSYVPKETDSKEYRTYMLTKQAQWQIIKGLTEEEQAEIDKFDALLNA